ncbi:hypothetical protein [Desulfovibrio cuneatus]|uniref:hypothetical protein n=1 Tax=Desulfovibrio cuneatus TaxID=159728 RepID=UPI00041C8FC6|nr:hypothetical protein [Desulfovibrio cuneatus]
MAKHIKAKNARGGCLLVIVLVVLAVLLIDKKTNIHPAEDAVYATLEKGQSIGKTDLGALFGGMAVVAENGVWWVKDGTVFAVNGIASKLSKGVASSPPSVDYAAAKAAVAGTPPAMPPHLPIAWNAVGPALKKALAEAKMPLQETSYIMWQVPVKSLETLSPTIELQETGGFVTQLMAYGEIGKGEAFNRPALAALMATMVVAVPSQEEVMPLFEQLMGGLTKENNTVTVVAQGMQFTLEKAKTDKNKVYLTLTIVPQPK